MTYRTDEPIGKIKVTLENGTIENYDMWSKERIQDFFKWLLENKEKEGIQKIEIEA